MRTLVGPVRELTAVAVSPDGAEVAACGGGPLHVWPGNDRRHDHDDAVRDLAYTPDGRWLVYHLSAWQWVGRVGQAADGNGLYALDRRGGGPAARLPGSLLLAVAGDRLLVRDDAAGAVGCLRVADRPPFPTLWQTPAGAVRVAGAAALLPDGRAILVNTAGRGGTVLELRAADTGDLQAAHPGVSGAAVRLAPAGDRLLLATGTRLTVWRTDDWAAAPAVVSLGRRPLRGLVWHPSGGYLLGVGTDGVVRRLDAGSWQVTATFALGGGKARAVAVAPDGLTAAAATSRGRVILFDLD